MSFLHLARSRTSSVRRVQLHLAATARQAQWDHEAHHRYENNVLFLNRSRLSSSRPISNEPSALAEAEHGARFVVDLRRPYLKSKSYRHASRTALAKEAGWRYLSSSSVVASAGTVPEQPVYPLSKQEMQDLVDIYAEQKIRDGGEHDEKYQSTAQSGVVPMIPSPQQSQKTSQVKVNPLLSEGHEAAVSRLRELLASADPSHEELFSLYQKLDSPQTSQIPADVLDTLLRQLASIEHKTKVNVTRFLHIANDVREAGRPLSIYHWNTAIHFTAKSFFEDMDERVEASMSLWRQLDWNSDVPANATTFNILFDIATKAGKFMLAEMIHDEMKRRRIRLDRYFRTSLIFHHGLRKDGDSVRRAYADLVDAGEIVDTAVINCVIAALLACGEAASADQIFARQKQMHAEKINATLPPTDWREIRAAGQWMKHEAQRRRKRKSEQKDLHGPFTPNHDPPVVKVEDQEMQSTTDVPLVADQDTTPRWTSIAPNLNTYNALIRHHAIDIGDIDHVAELVDEMEHFDVAVHGVIFLSLFMAFERHGGIRYSQWTLSRLENTWLSFLAAVDADNNAGQVYVSPPAAFVIAAAFHKCAGALRVADAWLDLRERMRGDFMADIPELEKRIGAKMGEDEPAFWNLIEQRTARLLQ